ncbi:MAG TPA: hypothetical protein VGC41_03640 [Kofleriaceae bacterium]
MIVIAFAALVGIAATIFGFVTDAHATAFAYLTAWWAAMSIAIGALGFLMITNVAEARWAKAYRRDAEAIAGTLPILALLFVPIALFAPELYAWIDPSPELAPSILRRVAHAHSYLNRTAWTIRAGVFLAIWIGLAEIVIRRRSRTASAIGLPLLGLTATFAAFDWIMSLTPAWASTIFGLACIFGGLLGAVALLAALNSVAAPMDAGALGRLVLGMLALWAYLELSQGLIIWLANKPDEVPWYVARGAGGWGNVLVGLVLGGFALPFVSLLGYYRKRRPRSLAAIGGWLVAMHVLDCYWLVMPVRDPAIAPRWMDAAAILAIGAVAVAFARARRSNEKLTSDYAEAA